MEKVFSDTEIEDEPTSEEEALAQAEKLNDRRVLLSGYLKLVIYSVVDINSALSVLAQYFKVCYKSTAPLIKLSNSYPFCLNSENLFSFCLMNGLQKIKFIFSVVFL